MSIKLLAQELYRCQKEVERLEAVLDAAPMDKRAVIEDQLRKAVAERENMRHALDGQLER